MAPEIQGNFVSEKISRVRWIPEEYVDTQHYVTGSWDNDTNSVKIWVFDLQNEDEVCYLPRCINERPIKGDITEIQLIDANTLAVSTSQGNVSLLYVSSYEKSTPVREIHTWNGLHKIGEESFSCAALATLDSEIVTVGEDGCINVLNARRNEVIRTISQADSCSLHCVSYIKHNEIITGNLRGLMKIWDLRSSLSKPVASFMLSGDEYAATCVVHHPTQLHMILAGSESGSLAVWDLRINAYPASLLNGHSAAVNEMQFHRENPQKLFTCSMNGEIWEWNMEVMTKSNLSVQNENAQTKTINTWLSTNDDKTKLMVTPLMPNLHKSINTLDCNKNRLLCGADNEAVYLIKKLLI